MVEAFQITSHTCSATTPRPPVKPHTHQHQRYCSFLPGGGLTLPPLLGTYSAPLARLPACLKGRTIAIFRTLVPVFCSTNLFLSASFSSFRSEKLQLLVRKLNTIAQTPQIKDKRHAATRISTTGAIGRRWRCLQETLVYCYRFLHDAGGVRRCRRYRRNCHDGEWGSFSTQSQQQQRRCRCWWCWQQR